MLRQEENAGVFILGQGKRNLHSSRSGNASKGLMGCFQRFPATVGGPPEGLAKGHQPKLHLHMHLLLPCAAHRDGLSWRECDHPPLIVGSPELAESRRVGCILNPAISPWETILLPSQSETSPLQSGNKRQGEVSMPFILPVSPNWELGNKCSANVTVTEKVSLLLQCSSDEPQMAIPLWKNMMALCRGDGPGFKKHWAHYRSR